MAMSHDWFVCDFSTGFSAIIPSFILAAVCFVIQQYDEQTSQLLAYNLREFPALQLVVPVIVLAPLLR